MNRLVEQLLFETSSAIASRRATTSRVDLRQVAEEVVGSMAHLALGTGRTIALTGAEHEVVILGNAAAIGDALRNLIENALAHTPQGTEVIVQVDDDETLSVVDSGPGIPVEDRARISRPPR